MYVSDVPILSADSQLSALEHSGLTQSFQAPEQVGKVKRNGYETDIFQGVLVLLQLLLRSKDATVVLQKELDATPRGLFPLPEVS